MKLTTEEQSILGGGRGDAARRALEYQIEVGKFWGAQRFVPVTNVHMMGDIEVMGDAGLGWLRTACEKGARCAIPITTNARCMDFAFAELGLEYVPRNWLQVVANLGGAAPPEHDATTA